MIGKLSTALLMFAISLAAHAGAIVVGKDSPITAMDADQARRIFLGLQRNLMDQAVIVIYQGPGKTRTDFENRILGKTGPELTTYMSTLIFTGRALPPVEVVGDEGVKGKIASTPGAIGYLDDSAVDDSVKVLLRY